MAKRKVLTLTITILEDDCNHTAETIGDKMQNFSEDFDNILHFAIDIEDDINDEESI
jgi:hypothetical protein